VATGANEGTPVNFDQGTEPSVMSPKPSIVIGGSSTQAGTDDYLILLSIYETCNYTGVNFLKFRRSGEKDIHAFAESRHGRKCRSDSDHSVNIEPS